MIKLKCSFKIDADGCLSYSDDEYGIHVKTENPKQFLVEVIRKRIEEIEKKEEKQEKIAV